MKTITHITAEYCIITADDLDKVNHGKPVHWVDWKPPNATGYMTLYGFRCFKDAHTYIKARTSRELLSEAVARELNAIDVWTEVYCREEIG